MESSWVTAIDRIGINLSETTKRSSSWLTECRQDLFGEKLQHLRMTFKRRIDELDLKMRDAGIGVCSDRPADFFWRADETYFRKLMHCQKSLKRGASYGQGPKTIFACFLESSSIHP